MALPRGRYPRDSWRALATAPLAIAIAVVGLVVVALIALTWAAVAAGMPAYEVLDRLRALQRWSQQPLLAAIGAILAWGLTSVLRRISQWAGIERLSGDTHALLLEVKACQDADRAEARRLHREQAADIDALAQLVMAAAAQMAAARPTSTPPEQPKAERPKAGPSLDPPTGPLDELDVRYPLRTRGARS